MDREALQKKIGNALRARRLALELSQEGLADKIEMHRAYYSSLERGEKNVELGTLLRVVEGLGISVFDLFEQARSAGTAREKFKPPGRPPKGCGETAKGARSKAHR